MLEHSIAIALSKGSGQKKKKKKKKRERKKELYNLSNIEMKQKMPSMMMQRGDMTSLIHSSPATTSYLFSIQRSFVTWSIRLEALVALHQRFSPGGLG